MLKKLFTFLHPYCMSQKYRMNYFKSIATLSSILEFDKDTMVFNSYLFSATIPLWDRTQAGHDVSDHRPRHVSRASWPWRIRARGGDQHLGHHRQPEQGDHQGNQKLSDRGMCRTLSCHTLSETQTMTIAMWRCVGVNSAKMSQHNALNIAKNVQYNNACNDLWRHLFSTLCSGGRWWCMVYLFEVSLLKQGQ